MGRHYMEVQVQHTHAADLRRQDAAAAAVVVDAVAAAVVAAVVGRDLVKDPCQRFVDSEQH